MEQINREEFDKVVKPLIEWMNNLHPHHTLLITGTSAELLEGVISTYTDEYVKD